MFWTHDYGNSDNQKEVLLLSLCLTCQVLLEWVIDTLNMKLSLSSHREKGFKEIPAEIPTSQKHNAVDKWHRVLGEIFSIAISLPVDRGLFMHMQKALFHMEGKGVELTRGIHQGLADFR